MTSLEAGQIASSDLAVTAAAASIGPAERPLVVDLDGTLLNSDMLAESYFALLAAQPVTALAALAELRHGRAPFKARVADHAQIDLALLPWNQQLLAFIRTERGRGRKVYLASASAKRFVEAVAAHLGVFDGVFSSDETVNLRSAAKADALCRAFGTGGFDYAGNESADLAVWDKAGGVLVVNGTPALQRQAKARWPDAIIMGACAPSIGTYARALRVHQWLKNLLVPVPALAAHAFGFGTLLTCFAAFLSFSLCASGVYVLNDLIDLGRDRVHPTKHNRPFASGEIPTPRGLLMLPILLGASLVLALLVRPAFVVVLAGYFVLTFSYSLVLKRRMMLDVVTLACLYGLRLVAGGVAAHVELSAWLAAFSLFLFCSLALLKRCTELVSRIAKGDEGTGGRAYLNVDLPILEALAAAAGFTAVLVFALYVNSETVQALYHMPKRLWLICVVLIYWVGRMLILTHRGQMHDDPVVFAATDGASLLCVLVALGVVLASI